MKKRAFTLSELLIVIALLAVIAMIIMPTVKNLMPDKNEYYFKKAYSAINQAVYEVSNNSFLYPPVYKNSPVLTQPNLAAIADPIVSGLNNMLNVPGGTALAESNYFCYGIRSVMALRNDGSTLSCNCPTGKGGSSAENFETADGTKFYGLCGVFTADGSKDVYIKVRADELDKKYGNTGKSVDDTLYTAQTENKWYIYRVVVTANGQILLKDEVERKIITGNKNI